MDKDIEEYKAYLETHSAGSGKVASYLTVIKKIGSIVNKVEGYEYVPDDFSSIRNLDLLWKVYGLVKNEQGKSDGGFFKNSTLTKAYWDSRHGFCSAAVRDFLRFRIETYDGAVPQVDRCNAEECFQRITYGAPGTGKSWGIEELVKTIPDRVFRTTFHPDCDYSTFVGAYKPTMESVLRLAIVGTQIEKVTFGSGFTDKEKSELEYEKKIVYKFVEQAFTKAYVKAWRAQAAAIEAGAESAEAVYLVIEEINRGNCAQVFGDIFQLLDRENGYSKYPVKADEDLRRHLEEAFDGLNFGAKYAKVQTGEDLVLPNNLCIWATMNTSDQSLFPMDSAFKRRWDWEYVPIVEGADKTTGEKLGWEILVKDGENVTRYDWWAFLEAVNDKIFQLTDSEDKKLGYFFAKPDGEDRDSHKGTISAKTFVGKVVFYLWNDVYKDYGIAEIFKGEQNGETAEDKKVKGVAYQAFYAKDGKSVNVTTLKNFFKAVGVEPKDGQQA